MNKEQKNAAAILLCAGKGTRMGNNERNKVAYDCAGVPVIKRIVSNMRAGGISRFVIVVGHLAESVMSALDGEKGILYAYQKEQKGTGHATACGLRALEDIGYTGAVVVSMGDKIVSVETVRRILAGAGNSDAICTCGVQRREEHPNGGHVIVESGKALGIVEYADVKRALAANAPVRLCGREFSVAEVAATPWVNTALYRFDAQALAQALATCGSDNAQGEIYLTDTIEYFARRGEVSVYRVESQSELLTYSTKAELRSVSRNFLKNAGDLLKAYPEHAQVISRFIARYGDRKAVVVRAPGRVNLMGRHIEHRGGSVNVMAVDAATVFVAAPREDDVIHLANASADYPECEFRIGKSPVQEDSTRSWLEWLALDSTAGEVAASQGSWMNYVKGAAYRLRNALDFDLCGMDVMADGSIPVAAGLSSSSSLVVATAEALSALNCLNMTDRQFVDLCGEGEWFVGSRGGAGDHAAMKCSRKGRITHLNFKPFSIGKSVCFPDSCSVIVADSLEQSKKSEGSKDKFNARIAAYEFAFMLIKRQFPEKTLVEFRDLAFCGSYGEVMHMLSSIPAKITRRELLDILPESHARLESVFATHADPGEYDLYGTALFGVSEIVRASLAPALLEKGDFRGFGEFMKISHDGDRVSGEFSVRKGASLEFEYGSYACSTPRIDALCDLMNATDGVWGSELAGAGLGGCVLILVDKEKTGDVMRRLNEEFYDRNGLPRSAFVCSPAEGSKIYY
jgi:N-acetylgalactosamine kinase